MNNKMIKNNITILPKKLGIDSLVKDSFVYGSASAISKLLMLMTFPMLANHFSLTEYGVLDFYMTLTNLLAIFFIFGQDSAVARYYYEYDLNTERRQLISQSLGFQLVGLCIFLPLAWLGAERLTTLLIGSANSSQLFKLILLQIPFLLFVNFSQNLLKWTFDRNKFLLISIGFTLTQASLLFLAVILFNTSLEGVMLINLATSIIFGILGIFSVRKWLILPNNIKYIRKMLIYAIPYGSISILTTISLTMERSLTNSLLGAEDLGFYAAASKIVVLISFLATAFQTAWGPFALAIHKKSDASETFNNVLHIYTIFMCFATMVLSLIGEYLLKAISDNVYINGAIVVFPLSMAFVIQSISWISEIGISISKRSYLNIYGSLLSILCTFLCIQMLVPQFGLLGVGLSVLMGTTIKAVISSWLAQRAYYIPWQYRPVFYFVLITLFAGLIALWLRSEHGVYFYNVILIAGCFFLLTIGWLLKLGKCL
jgi:O-antigen/teichoic acid export membrane protein